jgi:uncharacterized protein YbbK (DUF523 family)
VKVRVGISACLLGEQVRYDGGHKRSHVLADELATHVQWVPVCPEVGAGMTVPRPPLQLLGSPDAPRMVTIAGGIDWTDRMQAFIEAELRRFAGLGLSGFVFKSGSPSCGIRDIPTAGAGLFAGALMRELADLPVADEVEMEDPSQRAAFLDRVVAYRR